MNRNILMLYTHAWQSLFFNNVVSKRLHVYKLKIFPGDLVFCDDVGTTVHAEIAELVDLPENIDNITEAMNVEEAIKPNDNHWKAKKVKYITEEDIKNGTYTIYDVLIPLPGYDVLLPNNETIGFYEEIMKEDGLTIDNFRNKVKTFSLSGTYRKMLMKPENMTWEICGYNLPEDTLIASDYDLIVDQPVTIQKEGQSKFQALILNFDLPSGIYATMFLRELLRSDTSATVQSKLEKDALQRAEPEPHQPNNLKRNADSTSSISEVDEEVEKKPKIQE